MLTHDYDSARWLINSNASTIYGLAKVNDIDNCSLLVGFKNGVMGWFETTRTAPAVIIRDLQ